jgi:hypothetical protein
MKPDYSHAAFPGKPVQQADAREAALAAGLRRLAKRHGIAFREPLQIDSRGEFPLVVSNGTPKDGPQDFCGQYGEALAAVISRHNPRTGRVPTSYMSPENGWCRMNHFDVQAMLEEANP